MANANTFVISAPGRAKMSPQAAVGYSNWPDEDGRQTKHHSWRSYRSKKKTLRTHRTGK